MFFLKIFCTESDRYSRVKHKWQIAAFWSVRAPRWASAERELAQLKSQDTGSEGPEGAAHPGTALLVPVLLPPFCKASACALPEQAPWRPPNERGSPNFHDLWDKDCLSHSKPPTACFRLGRSQKLRITAMLKGMEAAQGIALRAPLCPASPPRPASASALGLEREEGGKKRKAHH